MGDPYEDDEITRGLVAFIDPDALEAAGATYTCNPTYRVRDSHYFVCLEVDDEVSSWTPLLSRYVPGREAIDMTDATGHPWFVDGYFNYHPGQIWTATADQIRVGAAADLSPWDNRNRLAEENTPVL